MKVLLIPVCLLLCLAVNAQVIIKSNNPAIKYNQIKPRRTVSTTFVFDSVGNKVGMSTSKSSVNVNQKTGQIAMSRLFTDNAANKEYIDTSYFTIAPATMHSLEHPAHKELHINFQPAQVIVNSLIDGVAKKEIYPMQEGYFDDNILVDIMGFFPIDKGIKYVMQGFRYESVKTKCISTSEVEYLHDDYLPVAGKQTLCKVLSYKNDYSDGLAWYDKVSGNVQKLLIKIRNKSYLITFEDL